MTKDPRLSHQTLRILRLFVNLPNIMYSGSEITAALKIGSGTVYPILARLERARWLKGTWERINPRTLGRPKMRFYQLTPLGRTRTSSALAELAK